MSECYVGEIRIWAGARIPSNWALCNGQTVNIADYEVLYALIGTTYGGDGKTNFKLPNLQGLLPIGQGQGVGLTNRVPGQSLGAETVTISEGTMPAHNHPYQASAASATTGTPDASSVLAAPAGNFYSPVSDTTKVVALNDIAVSPNEGLPNPQAHENMMPATALNYIIAMNGIFPQRPS
jgi:microcystin-dependent protein